LRRVEGESLRGSAAALARSTIIASRRGDFFEGRRVAVTRLFLGMI